MKLVTWLEAVLVCVLKFTQSDTKFSGVTKHNQDNIIQFMLVRLLMEHKVLFIHQFKYRTHNLLIQMIPLRSEFA